VADVLLGKAIRCPNSSCRLEFAVGMTPPADPPPQPLQVNNSGPGRGPGGQWSGSVDDLLEVVPAEPTEATPPTLPTGSMHVSDFLPVVEAESAAPPPRKPVEASWDQPPPVRGPQSRPAPPQQPSRKTSPRNGQGQKNVATKPTQAPTPAGRPTKVESPDTLLQYPGEPPARLEPVQEALPPVEENSGPVELPPGSWEATAPPVRQGAEEQIAQGIPESGEGLSPEVAAQLETARKRRRSRLLIGLIGVLVVAVVGVGAWVIWGAVVQTEAKRAEIAYKEFTDGRYSEASEDFGDLRKRFANTSKHLDEYKSMQVLSDLLQRVTTATASSSADEMIRALDQVATTADGSKSDEVIKSHIRPLGDAFGRMVEKLVEGEEAAPSTATPDRLAKVETALTKIGAFGGDVWKFRTKDQWQGPIQSVREKHQSWARRLDAHLRVLTLLRDNSLPRVDAYKTVQRLLHRYENQNDTRGLSGDQDIVAAFNELYQRHFDSIVFIPAEAEADKPAGAEVTAPTILFDPRLDQQTNTPRPRDDTVVLSLVRGVLYAHSRATGEVLWLIRVGVDTTTLPIRVAETASCPERILVLLADTETLSALDPSGNEVWRYRLGSPCLGKPVVVNQSVLLPTYDGNVHEVELAGGKLLGRWQLGQHLSSGGALERRSSTVYFPADDTCVYALNVDPKNRHCERILYSNHPAGTLRGEPLIFAPAPKAMAALGNNPVSLPSYLVLNETDGLDATKMHVFPLPLADRNGPPVNLGATTRLPGWTWFTPFHDAEKLLAVTDAGVLGVMGINQLGNEDPALFPIVAEQRLYELMKTDANTRTRSQIVAAQGEDLWVLSGGKLQRLAKTWNAEKGPQLIARWPEGLNLGSAVHASQVVEDPSTGQGTLVVVTQALKQRVFFATAVRDEDGHKLWQRQLGLVCQGAPVLLGKAPAPMILTLGQSGELFALDPQKFAKQQSQWLSGARSLLAGPLDDNALKPPVLLAGGDGLSAFEVAFPGASNRMVIRRVRFDPATRKTTSTEQEVKLPVGATAAGPATLVGEALIVPLTSGPFLRVSLSTPAATGRVGATWRSARIGSEAPGYVTALGPDTLAATDGGRGLNFWKISPDGVMSDLFQSMDRPDEDSATLELEDRVASSPVLLTEANGAQSLLLVDAGGVLRKIKINTKGAKEDVSSRLDLQGRVTVGPFLKTVPGTAARVGCVLDGNRLVWIDPAQGKAPLWEYKTASGAAIVGEPQLVAGKLLVAEQGGAMAALDPATGKRQGSGYSLPGSVAPAAPPLAFDADSLFTPLTDGTVLLLPMKLFRQ
jgi:outer membrane protein assembly factor BamB